MRLLSATRGRHHRTGEGGRRGKGRTGACVGPLDSPRNAPRVVAAGVRFRSSRAYSPTNQKSTALDCAHEESRCERPDSAPPPPRCVVEDVDHASTATSARPAQRGATKSTPRSAGRCADGAFGRPHSLHRYRDRPDSETQTEAAAARRCGGAMSKWVTAGTSVNVRMLYRRVLGAARVFPTSKRASVRCSRAARAHEGGL